MGVVAMPKDTPANRARAVALMHSHFPEGYEIVSDGQETVVTPQAAAPKESENVHRKQLTDTVTAVAWSAPRAMPSEFDGTPRSSISDGDGLSIPLPAVGLTFTDPDAGFRDEGQIVYRRKGAPLPTGEPQSLFPNYRSENEKPPASP